MSSLTGQSWHQALHHCQTTGQGYVLITLLAAAGSTPREAGCKMVVTADSSFDTIGGGHLEHQVITLARELLAKGQDCQHIETYPLASRLGQCCGGATRVLLEVMAQHGQQLAVFGAGHVAHALVPILAQLPLQIRWVDSRAELFPAPETLPVNVEICCIDEPVDALATLAPSAWALILTHNHQLDFDLVRAALTRGDLTYVGMIGSDTKARRFRQRLAHREFSPQQIDQLISPVGITDIPGKRPIEVAVSIAGQLIQRLNNAASPTETRDTKTQWQQSRLLEEILR